MHPYDMVFSNLTIEYERSMLKKEQIPEVAKKAIINFVDGDLLLENIGEKRRMNYYQRLRVVARWIPDNFTNPSKEDVKKIMLQDTKGRYIGMLKNLMIF